VGDRVHTVAFTDELAVRVDGAQYDIGSGPLLDAMATEELVHVHHVATESRWDDFPRLAVSCGGSALCRCPHGRQRAPGISGVEHLQRSRTGLQHRNLHFAVRFASSAETTVLKHDECARMHGR
jgi:hypothetical protein